MHEIEMSVGTVFQKRFQRLLTPGIRSNLGAFSFDLHQTNNDN